MTAVMATPAPKIRRADPPDVPTWSPRLFARALEAARLRSGERKTQQLTRIAGEIGTTVQTLYAWKKGAGEPGVNDALKLAQLLGVTLSDLIE